MKKLILILIGLSALGFILASIASVFGSGYFLIFGAESLSRASNNLALIAIALTLWLKMPD
jgi:Ni/Fe-hydrogenase subunit HybB-like protein